MKEKESKSIFDARDKTIDAINKLDNKELLDRIHKRLWWIAL